MPGPGSYDPMQYSDMFFRSSKFGSGLRISSIGSSEKSPGPGRYDIGSPIKSPKHTGEIKHATFGEAKKKSSVDKSNTPGPG